MAALNKMSHVAILCKSKRLVAVKQSEYINIMIKSLLLLGVFSRNPAATNSNWW